MVTAIVALKGKGVSLTPTDWGSVYRKLLLEEAEKLKDELRADRDTPEQAELRRQYLAAVMKCPKQKKQLKLRFRKKGLDVG